MYRCVLIVLFLVVLPGVSLHAGEPAVKQVTSGPSHHFYGYIGQCGNTPWNGNGQYMVLLRSAFQDHMPSAAEAADIVLLATEDGAETKLDETRAWNFQQGTMLYWHPKAVDTQFFFNDRDPTTGKIFCVLYDIVRRERVREYRFEDTPVGNSGVARDGEHFFAINYARLARLRPVTGYPESFDWTQDAALPENDGIWKVNIASGEKSLLVSYRQLGDALQPVRQGVPVPPLFINHTLVSRDSQWLYAYARAGWNGEPKESRIDAPFIIKTNGNMLKIPLEHIGGHPEWAPGNLVVGAREGRQVLYDPFEATVARAVGTEETIPEPGGDVSISFDGKWLVNGWHTGQQQSCYVLVNLESGETIRTPCVAIGRYTSGNLRIDPAPCWKRDGTAIAVPGLAEDGTRQTFVISLK